MQSYRPGLHPADPLFSTLLPTRSRKEQSMCSIAVMRGEKLFVHPCTGVTHSPVITVCLYMTCLHGINPPHFVTLGAISRSTSPSSCLDDLWLDSSVSYLGFNPSFAFPLLPAQEPRPFCELCCSELIPFPGSDNKRQPFRLCERWVSSSQAPSAPRSGVGAGLEPEEDKGRETNATSCPRCA